VKSLRKCIAIAGAAVRVVTDTNVLVSAVIHIVKPTEFLRRIQAL